MKFKIVVAFTVDAEAVGPWDAETCAMDFVRHRIDEGYRMEPQIESWEFVSVNPDERAASQLS